MQAPWTRTPLRLAVPVTRGLSCLNSTTINTFNSPLLTSPYSLPSSHSAASKPPISSPHPTLTQSRSASSSSGSWKIRQRGDYFARSARVEGYKSRAAFKLFEIDIKYGLFHRHAGQVVVDLGYAPGSWSQVAVDRTAPNGTVLGIDIIPAQPPKGVSTIQGNFLSPRVREVVKQVLVEGDRRRREERRAEMVERRRRREGEEGGDEVLDRPSYIDMERMAAHESDAEIDSSPVSPSSSSSLSPDESTEAKEESTQSKEESTQPTEDRTQPTEESTLPKEESAQPAEEITQPKEGKKSNLRLVDVGRRSNPSHARTATS